MVNVDDIIKDKIGQDIIEDLFCKHGEIKSKNNGVKGFWAKYIDDLETVTYDQRVRTLH